MTNLLGLGRPNTDLILVNKAGRPVRREGPKWEPERLEKDTLFILGSRANKVFRKKKYAYAIQCILRLLDLAKPVGDCTSSIQNCSNTPETKLTRNGWQKPI